MIRSFRVLLLCRVFGSHEWTCAAEQGTPPTEAQVAGGVEGFFDYAKMYCLRCGREAEISKKHRGVA